MARKKIDTRLMDYKCPKCKAIRTIRIERRIKKVICSNCGAKNEIK